MNQSIFMSYDATTVSLSLMVACFSVFVSMDLIGRARKSTSSIWLVGSGVTLGGGIWLTQFLGMLALHTSVPKNYDDIETLSSLLVTILMSIMAIYFIVKPIKGGAFIASLLLTSNMLLMYWLGTDSINSTVTVHHSIGTLAISCLLSFLLCWFGGTLLKSSIRSKGQFIVSLAFSIAILGMHYIALWSAKMSDITILDNSIRSGLQSGKIVALNDEKLASLATLMAFVILSISLWISLSNKQLEEKNRLEANIIKTREEEFRVLYRNSTLPLHALDENNIIQEVSDIWLELLGYRYLEVIGKPITFFLKEPWKFTGNYEQEYQMTRWNGEVLDVLISQYDILDDNGDFKRRVGGLVDVTARKTAENALRQSQKMEIVGQLTSGMAHDFNNLMTIIISGLEMGRKALQDGNMPKMERSLDRAIVASERATSLTQHLLAFSRKQALTVSDVNLNSLITDNLEFIRQALNGKVDLKTCLNSENEPYEVVVDPTQLLNALLNLVINARDALLDHSSSQPRVTITTKHEQDYTCEEESLSGDYVVLQVSDNGPGMSAEVASRVFEPFFTTKGIGKGSGLGLSQVFGFVKQSEGHISLVTQPNQGACFSIWLPRKI